MVVFIIKVVIEMERGGCMEMYVGDRFFKRLDE